MVVVKERTTAETVNREDEEIKRDELRTSRGKIVVVGHNNNNNSNNLVIGEMAGDEAIAQIERFTQQPLGD